MKMENSTHLLTPRTAIEGYVLIVSNLHPETNEDNIYDVLEDFCRITNLHLNHDKRTGFVKGYALVEVSSLDDAMEILDAHKEERIEILGQELDIDFALVKPPHKEERRRNAHTTKGRHNSEDERDISPSR